MEKINLYGKEECNQCWMTERALDKQELDYTKYDVEEDENALQAVRDLGYQQVPVVTLEDNDGEVIEHWSGYRHTMLRQLGKRALEGKIAYKESFED